MSHRLVLALAALVLVAGACAGTPAPPRLGAGRRAAAPVATRTVVEVGPDEAYTYEIVRVDDDAHAVVTTAIGPLGEEMRVGHHHYVRHVLLGPVYGIDEWIHIDLSDPRQREFLEANAFGWIAAAGVADAEVGDELAGHEVLAVTHPAEGSVLVDLGEGRTIARTIEPLPGVRRIEPPDPATVIELAELADHAQRPPDDLDLSEVFDLEPS